MIGAGAAGAVGVVLRRGRAGESFVFNASGQTIDVGGLLCVAREGGDCLANPVKDSMEAKLRPESQRFAAFLYGTRAAFTEAAVLAASQRLAALIARECGARASARVI